MIRFHFIMRSRVLYEIHSEYPTKFRVPYEIHTVVILFLFKFARKKQKWKIFFSSWGWCVKKKTIFKQALILINWYQWPTKFWYMHPGRGEEQPFHTCYSFTRLYQRSDGALHDPSFSLPFRKIKKKKTPHWLHHNNTLASKHSCTSRSPARNSSRSSG